MKPFTQFMLICALGIAWQTQAQAQGLNDSAGQADSSKTFIRTKKWSHEIGINVYSFAIRGGNFYSNYKTLNDHYAVSGLYLKWFHGKSAIRTSVDYFQKIIIDRPRAIHDKDVSFKTIQITAGYQRHFGNKNVMPYIFTDLAYSNAKELVQTYFYDPLYLPYYPYQQNLITVKTSAVSASPGIGLRLRLKKNMILNLETAAEFFYMKQFDTDQNDARNITGFNVKPLRCSFGFIF
jgi:hypothetical protein